MKKLSEMDRPYDAMPTTFNFPVVHDTLDIHGGQFLVWRADGTPINPVCAFVDPANEPNEGHTVTLIGHFGGRTEKEWPVSIQVVSEKLKLYNNVSRKYESAAGLKLERATGGTKWK